MAENSAGFRVYADATAFEKGMAQAVNSAEKAGKAITKHFEARDIGRTLAAALGINLTSIADKVARLVIGFSNAAEDALELMVAATGKAADAQEKLLEMSRRRIAKEKEDKKKLYEDEDELINNFLRKEYDRRSAASLKQIKDRREQEAELSRLNNAEAEARMSNEQRLADFRRQDAAAVKEIAQLEALGNKRSIDDTNTLIELKTAHADLQEKIKTAVVGTGKAEANVTEEIIKQLAELNKVTAIKGVRGVAQFGQASEAALQETIRRNQKQIQDFGPFTGIGQNMEIARLQAEIQNVKQELAFRSNLQADVRNLGVEGARSRFGGDPLAFDRLVQQYVEDARDLKKINAESNELLRQMNQKIKTGLPVVNLNPGGG